MNAVQSISLRKDFTPRERASMDTPELVDAAQEVLAQGLSLLFQLSDRTYASVASAPFNASVGQHFRHVLEHFQCLINGMRAGEVNYDARDRNHRLETEVTYSTVATCDVLRALKRYTDETLARDCKIIHSVGYGTVKPSSLESNVGRELAYCVGHAIHHYAIIRLVCNEIDVTVPPEFGFAPSTVKHMAALAAD